MKKGILITSLSLLSMTISAQSLHPFTFKKSKAKTEVGHAKQDVWNTQWKKMQNRVNNAIAIQQMSCLFKATETVSTTLLDEVMVDNREKRTYTYSPNGTRDEIRAYLWEQNEWRYSSNHKYSYTFDQQGRCLSRAIALNGKVYERVELSYENGNTHQKVFELYTDALMLSYERTIDPQGRELMNKDYEQGELRTWRERLLSASGEVLKEIYWYNDEGTKTEVTHTELQFTRSNYQWNKDTKEWEIATKQVESYNAAGRVLSRESCEYIEGGEVIMNRETFTYDAYQRTISNVYDFFEDNRWNNSTKEEYTYWGTEYYGPDGSETDDSEGPVLTYKEFYWENNQWMLADSGEITRNASGIAQSATAIEYGDSEINGVIVDTKEMSLGIYNEKGYLTQIITHVYRADNNDLLLISKNEMEYNQQNRNTRRNTWERPDEESEWTLTREELTEYNAEGVIMAESQRSYHKEFGWSGYKWVFLFSKNSQEKKSYTLDENGNFRTTPFNYQSESLLENGRTQFIQFEYDDNGNIVMGMKRETMEGSIHIKLPSPESYNDGVNLDVITSQPDINYTAEYKWENNQWVAVQIRGYEQVGNEIIFIVEFQQRIIEKIVYTLDNEDRFISYQSFINNGDQLVIREQIDYQYNAEGQLSQKNENGVITTYKYSKHDVTGLEKQIISTITINGRTVTVSEMPLEAYTVGGILVAKGKESITLPEPGIYIIVANGIRQKVVVQ